MFCQGLLWTRYRSFYRDPVWTKQLNKTEFSCLDVLDQPVYRPGWTDLWTDIVSCPSVFNINITIKTGKPRSFMDVTIDVSHFHRYCQISESEYAKYSKTPHKQSKYIYLPSLKLSF